uniref:ATP synthase F0 subunit 8 n=1 Tax=Pentatomidae sp. GM-2014 TaxID=1651278 RepID=A0A0A0VFZ4_9HEMI|nr:ATP synthase F0 subunit 8 [Pentatomidae sp. GM-2014]AIW65015.1 ATP synthase F0 subunit 8 [Pentatomidae sp. GM-2014]
MPQMAPLWWETLYVSFLMSFIIMNMMIYFSKTIKIKKEINNKSWKTNKQMTWMW